MKKHKKKEKRKKLSLSHKARKKSFHKQRLRKKLMPKAKKIALPEKKPEGSFQNLPSKMNGIIAVVFFSSGEKKSFLVLRRILNWHGWELLKGSIEESESAEDSVSRELFEETGLSSFISARKLPVTMNFFDPIRRCQRIMQGFLVEVAPGENVSFSNNSVQEHGEYRWVDSQTALQMLTHGEQKKVLEAALAEIEKT